jgi:hypothetical protein
MNTLTAKDVRRILRGLDHIETLTNLLRHKHYEVPSSPVYGAAGAVTDIRDTLLRIALVDIAVEHTEIEFAREFGITALAANEDAAVDRDFTRWDASVRAA